MLSKRMDENFSPRIPAGEMSSAPTKNRQSREGRSSSRASKPSSNVNKRQKGGPGLRMRDVDVLTGQKITMVYFNPDLAIGLEGPQTSKVWRENHSFEPAGVVSEDQTTGVLKVRLRTISIELILHNKKTISKKYITLYNNSNNNIANITSN